MKVRYHMDDPLTISSLAKDFSSYIKEFNPRCLRPIVVVGIGTDRSTGDSLGPLVGTKLSEYANNTFHIYGTIDNPVHATNLTEKISEIEELYTDPFVVAIDACLGRLENVGTINLASGAVKPGTGVNKKLPEVGHIHYTGIVNVGGYMEFMVLQNTRLSVVMKMANTIATSIFYGYHKVLLDLTNQDSNIQLKHKESANIRA